MMAAGGVGAGAASTSAGSAPTAGASRSSTKDSARDSDSGGFAGVLAKSSAGNGAASDAATKEAKTPTVANDTHDRQPADADKTTDEDQSPDRILAMLGGHWPAPAPLTPTALATGADASLALAADSTTLTASVASAGKALGQLAATDSDLKLPAFALGPTTLATNATLAANANAASADGAFPVADFARAMGLAAADDAGKSLPAAPTVGADADAIEFSLPPQPLTGNSPVRAAAATAATPIPMPADPDSGFDDALGARIGWLADQRIGRAEIRVSPDHLGPIDVRLHIDGNRVSAEFNSANADVRQALEASVGRLRDMLGQQGLQLAQSDVGSGQSNSSAGYVTDAGSDRRDADIMDTPIPTILRRGLLDEYA
ncbi:flagellar hook-length control protein FliK [Lysobacter sp. A378]